jgi:catechol 2,3-dioxygenase-like lactoylglutathione lyase family enzyme
MLATTDKEGEMLNAQPEGIIPVSDLERAVSFYTDKVGLEVAERFDDPDVPADNPMVRLGAGNGTVMLYKSVGAGQTRHTLVGLNVDDIESAVAEMRGRGVTFEEYDMGEIKTENGIARMGRTAGAWFKDPDGNIIGVAQYM